MSIGSPFAELSEPVKIFVAPGFPSARHPAEADLFSRQAAMPGHDQRALESAHVCVVGCGGLGGGIAMGLARMGLRRLTLIDDDAFDRTNAPRQLVTAVLLGQNKAHAVAEQLIDHMTNPGRIVAIASRFTEATALPEEPTALIVGVDNNRARLEASAYGLRHRVPAVFVALSSDGLRAQIFLQVPGGACLRCVLPDHDVRSAAPCAAAAITSCSLASSHAVALLTSAIMGNTSIFPHWRETSLDGSTERALNPKRRAECSCRGSD